MDRRGIAEVGSATLGSGVLAVAGLRFVGKIDWITVVGLMAGVAIAVAANYRARTRHAAHVAAEAPAVTEDNYEQHGRPKAGDGGTPSDEPAQTDRKQ